MYPRGLHQERGTPNQSQRPPPQQQRGQFPPRGQPASAQAPQDPASRQRRMVTDKLIADCYSKRIADRNGRPFVETSYQTHVSIKEYSSYPSQPPPGNLPPNQIGTVKDRVLALCVKYSGRVLIQKGKYNESKDVYQIGRTWDMDELKAITRAGENGIILTLNKDYYWSVEGGPERIWKFARFLTNAYGGFMAGYPTLNGFSIQDFNLPPNPVKRPFGNSSPGIPGKEADNDIVVSEPQPNPQLLKTRSLKRKHLPKPVLPPQPSPPIPTNQPQNPNVSQRRQEDLYKDLDFTANGKLPMKPMNVMQVDRPSSTSINQIEKQDPHLNSRSQPNQSENQHEEFVENYVTVNNNDESVDAPNTPDLNRVLQMDAPADEDITRDSQSFVFKADNTYSPDKLHEYANTTGGGATSPLRKYKPRRTSDEVQQRKVSEPFESAAALGIQLEERLGDGRFANTSLGSGHSFQIPAAKEHEINSPDLGIEEVEDDSDDQDVVHDQHLEYPRERNFENQTEPDVPAVDESTKLDADKTIDSSIQDIENYMDSQLYFAPEDEGNDTKNSIQIGNVNQREINEQDIRDMDTLEGNILERNPIDQDESLFTHDTFSQTEEGLNIQNKDAEFQGEKDAELEELLEEVNWTISDNGDSLIKKLTKELNNVKYRNVKDLVTLDFSKDSVSNDVTTSINEIENLSHIFKKMEIDFKFLAPEVNLIENNSKGLQVKSINKKLLYNDLSGILKKVSMNSDDLRAIESFKEFDRLNKLESIEIKLLGLYNALGTIGQDYNENNDNLSSMNALKQYKSNYERVTARFIKHFSYFIKEQFRLLVLQLTQNLDRFYSNTIFRELNNLLIYSGFTYFIKGVSPSDFQDINGDFNQLMSDFLEKILSHKLKQIRFSSSSVSSHLSQSLDNTMPLKKSRTLRLSTKRDKYTSKMGQSEDMQSLKQNSKNSNEIDDPKAVVEVIDETKDMIFVLQYFLGRMFHYDTNIMDFNDYCTYSPYRERRKALENPSLDKIDSKNYTNDLITNLNAVFGGYINIFMKKVTPTELNIPLLLCYLENLLNDSKKSNQEFLVFNFLKKTTEKFRGIWSKFIKTQVSLLNKSVIVANCGVLPAIKNINQLLLLTESSLDQPGRGFGDINQTLVRLTLNESYKEISEAAIHLFMRDDPLLKNHDFDDKEREHRNVSIIQNVYYLSEQLTVFNSEGTNKMRSQLDSVFNKVLNTYFNKLLNKNIGKLVEFVNNYEALARMNNGKPKKYNKKYVKSLLTGYTSKDISLKATEIYRKLEKYFITGGDMFEKDLLDKLWSEMEGQFIDYFTRLNTILRGNFDREIDYSVTKQDIHSIFTSIH